MVQIKMLRNSIHKMKITRAVLCAQRDSFVALNTLPFTILIRVLLYQCSE